VEHQATVTTLSWIPSEAVVDAPLLKATFSMGFTHYDTPPPDVVAADASLEQLSADDVFRFAHRLCGVIEVDGDRVVSARYAESSYGMMGGTTVRLAGLSTRLTAVGLPPLQAEPELTATSATFRQTFGGRTGLPAPRRVEGRPHARWQAPTVWTTLALTMHADGRVEFDLTGASPFPRHWVYGPDGHLASKSGTTEFNTWYHGAHGQHTPWGDEDAPALVVAVESALERRLAGVIMGGGKPGIRQVEPGTVLIEEGAAAGPVLLVLDGLISVEVDGESLGDLGPGAVVGERAFVEGTPRTATVRALTPVRVAVIDPDRIDGAALSELTGLHRREERQLQQDERQLQQDERQLQQDE
jgi:hypothetical protein